MSDLGKTLAAELFKLRRQRSTYILPLLVAALAALLFVLLEFAAHRDWFGVPSGHFLAASVLHWMNNAMALLAVVLTSYLISQEFALGTVKSTWVRPLTRTRWYLGKLLVAAALLAGLFLLVLLVTVLLGAFGPGFTDLKEKDFLVHSAGDLTGHLLLSAGLTLWALWAAVVCMAAVACLFAHTGGAIATGLAAGVLMTVLGAVPALRPWLLSTHFTLPSEQMVAMSKGIPLPLAWSTLVWRTLLGAGAWMLLAFLLGQAIIRRKEISN